MRDEEIKILRDSLLPQHHARRSSAQTTTGKLVDDKGKVLSQKGVTLTEASARRGPAQVLGRAPGRGRRRSRAEAHASSTRSSASREEHFRDKIDRLSQGRRAAAGRHQDGEGLHRHQAQAPGRRQDGRSSRQQGCRLPHPRRRGHAVPAGRHAGRHRAQPARRSEPHERRSDPRDAPRLGRSRPRQAAPVHARSQVRRRRSSAQHIVKIFDGDREIDEVAREADRRRGPSRRGQASTTACTSRRRCSTARTEQQIKNTLALAGLPTQRSDDPLRRPHRRSRSTRT